MKRKSVIELRFGDISIRCRVIYFLAVFLLSFAVMSYGINETGETWDEIAYYNAGRHYLIDLKEKKLSRENWDANKEHPPLGKWFYGFASRYAYRAEGENFAAGRYASAAALSLAVALTFYLLASSFSLTVAAIAAIILALSPPFVAYGRVLGLDSVTTLMSILCVVMFYRFALSRAGPADYILPTLVLGLSWATRYNLIIATAFLPLAVLLFAKWRTSLIKWLSLALIPMGAFVVFYALWPFLWGDPIGALRESLDHWGQVREWYLGKGNLIPPWSYFLTYYFVMTPAAILGFFVVGLFSRPLNAQKVYFLGILALIIAGNSLFGFKQGGIRYTLFIWIPLATIAALGFTAILKKIKKPLARLALALVLVGYLIFQMISVYPYYLDYYNEIVGGPKGVFERELFLLGWWGEGAKRAGDYLNSEAARGTTVWNAMQPDHTLDNLREDIRRVSEDEDPDFIVYNTLWSWADGFEHPRGYAIVHQEKAAGAPIITILGKE